ncbi:MAG: hypothetical protein ACR2G6_06405 [Gemmatimonadaceae bacterium]
MLEPIAAVRHADSRQGLSDDRVARASDGGTVHMLAMLGVAGVIAVVVYEWVGLAFLRRGWINFDLLWALALFAAGAVLLLPALHA